MLSKSLICIAQGYFKAEIFEDSKCIYAFEDHNKVTLGASWLMPRMLSGHTQEYTANPLENTGITKFVLFGIDEDIGTCQNQMLAGSFDDYNTLDPKYLTDIDITSFPCLKSSDTIVATDVPEVVTNDCSLLVTPDADDASILSTVSANEITFCVSVGEGYAVAGNPSYHALAALVGRSLDPTDVNEYVIALEQFPVMVKTSTNIFNFSWLVYF